jgi:hypothetical protein
MPAWAATPTARRQYTSHQRKVGRVAKTTAAASSALMMMLSFSLQAQCWTRSSGTWTTKGWFECRSWLRGHQRWVVAPVHVICVAMDHTRCVRCTCKLAVHTRVAGARSSGRVHKVSTVVRTRGWHRQDRRASARRNSVECLIASKQRVTTPCEQYIEPTYSLSLSLSLCQCLSLSLSARVLLSLNCHGCLLPARFVARIARGLCTAWCHGVSWRLRALRRR